MRILLILILFSFIKNLNSQDFGCFEVSEFPTHSMLYSNNRKPISNYDSIFWLQFKLDNVSDGYCKILWNKYQTKMEGNIVNGKREGVWKFYKNEWDYKSGYEKIYLVNFVNNKKEGNYQQISVFYKDTSVVLAGSYVNDLMEGRFLSYSHDTVIVGISNYKNGKSDGVFIDYDFTKNNTKYVRSIKYYKNGLRNGNEIVFKRRHNNIILDRIFSYSNDTLKEEIYFNEKDDIKTEVYLKMNSEDDTIIKVKKNWNTDSSLLKQTNVTDWILYRNDDGTKDSEGKRIWISGKYYRDSTWTYYYKTGELKALINYNEGKKIGESKYFDKTGKLKRMEIIKNDGSSFNIYEGDTINCIDNKGLKQGKWISLPSHSLFDNNECNDLPDGIRYFKDNKPIGKWEIKSGRFYRIHDKSVYIWIDSTLAYCYNYSKNNIIIDEGEIIDMTYKFGIWKEYDSEKGFLKAEGTYYLDRKIGKWTFYKKNGKVKCTKVF